MTERYLRLGIVFLIIVVPLAFVTKEFLYIEAEIVYVEAPKTFILRAVTATFIPCVIYLFWRGPPPLNWQVLPVLAFVGWAIIATVFSMSPRLSYFGEFPGQDSYNLLGTGYLLVLFLSTIVAFRTREDIKLLLTVTAISGTLASIPVLLQAFQLFPIDLIAEGVGRPSGTFGNPVFAAGFITLTLAVTLYTTRFNSYLWGPAAFQFLALFAIQSRAGFIGVAVMLAWMVIEALRKQHFTASAIILPSPAKWSPRHLAVFIAPLIFLMLAGSWLPRLTQLSDISGRLAIWETSLEIITDHPITGAGPDMFRYAHLQRAPATPTGLVEEPDHAHNWVIHNGAEMGVPGAVAAAALLLAPLAGPFGVIFVGRGAEQMFGLARISDLMLMFILLGASHNAYSLARRGDPL